MSPMPEPAAVTPAPSLPGVAARRWGLAALGCACVAIGAVGVALPILPTTPFMILAAACFVRSSPRLHRALLASRLFGPTIRRWQESRTIPVRAKVAAIGLIAVTMTATIILAAPPVAASAAMVATGLVVSAWLVRVPSR